MGDSRGEWSRVCGSGMGDSIHGRPLSRGEQGHIWVLLRSTWPSCERLREVGGLREDREKMDKDRTEEMGGGGDHS